MTILIRPEFRDAVLIKGEALIRRLCLFEARRLLEEIRYTLTNKISQLSSKCNHGKDIHKHEKC